MKTIDAAVLAELQADALAPVFLLEITWPGAGAVRWASEGEDRSHDGHTWDGRPFTLQAPQQQAGAGNTWGLTVADADTAVTQMVTANDPAGAAVVLYRAVFNLATGASIGAETLATGIVGGLSWDETSVNFEVIAARSALARKTPGLTYDRACQREYASPDSGYNTCQHAATCGHTWADCAANSYTANYGGVPMLSERVF